MGQYVVVALFAAGVMAYVIYKHKRSGATQGGMARHCGLGPGDAVKYWWSAEYIKQEVPRALEVGAVAAGLLVGALITFQKRGVGVAVSEQGNLVLLTGPGERGEVSRKAFRPDDGLQIDVLGPGKRRVQGGPSQRVRFTGPEGQSLTVLIHESAPPLLQQWAAAA